MIQRPSDQTGPSAAPTVPAFPCAEFPTETRHARLLGIYPQRQEGRWMHRVRIPGGILSPDHWRALASIAREFTPATPLHLTTRQDIELHDLSDKDVPAMQRSLAQAGLTSLASGGDTLRNIVVCPCAAGGTSHVPDLLPLGRAIEAVLTAYEGIFTLPRKFKISLGCQRGCGRPFIHDLSFVAIQRGDRWGLQAIGAGSLGAKPATGIVLFDWIAPTDALPLSLAAVKLFAQHGDRQNRTKARLRHVRQRMGDSAFLAALGQEFQAVKTERAWPDIELRVSAAAGTPRILTFQNGDISPDAADGLATLAELPGLSVRISNDHRVHLMAPDERAVDDQLHRLPALAANARSQANVVACPGTRWCPRGLADTNHLADTIRAALAGEAVDGLHIAVSGCPNGCAANAVADIGIIGGRSSADGQPVEKYALLSGGGRGATDALAQPVAAGLLADQTLMEVIQLAKALLNASPGRHESSRE